MATFFDRLFLQPVCGWHAPNFEENRDSFTVGFYSEVNKVLQNGDVADVQLVRTAAEVCEPTHATGMSGRIGRIDQFSVALPLTARKIRELLQPMFELVCEVPTIEWCWTILVLTHMSGQVFELSALIDPNSAPLLC